MFALLGRAIVAHPWKFMLAAALVATLAFAGISRTRFVSDYDATLPNRSPLTTQIHSIQDRFGSRSTLALLVAGGSDQARMQAACRMGAALEQIPGVAPGRVYGVGSNTLKYAINRDGELQVVGLGELCATGQGLTREVLDGLGPQAPLVRAPNGDLTLYADLEAPSGEYGDILAQIDSQIGKIAGAGVSIAYSGQPAFLAQNDMFSKRIALFFPGIMLLILLLHWEALRSVQAVVIPIFTGLTATMIAIGVYGWVGYPLDTYAVLAPILVLAVGAGHSVQLLKRYMEEVAQRVPEGERATKAVNDEALVTTITAIGPVLTLAVSGAAACLFALLLLDVAALARFGVLAGVGIIAALFLELTFVPAIRAVLPPPRVRRGFGELSGMWSRGLAAVGKFALRGPKGVIFAGLALLVVALVFGVATVKPSHSISVYTDADLPVQKTVTRLRDAGVGPYVLDVVIDTGSAGKAFEPQSLEMASELQGYLAKDPAVRSTLSASSVIGFLKCRFADLRDCASPDARISSADEANQIWTILFGGGREAGLIDETGRYLRVRAFVSVDETNVAARLIKEADEFSVARGVRVEVGGSALAAKALADGIVQVSLEKALLLIVIVTLIGALAFRSLKMAAMFALPSMLTVLTNFAYLGWSGTSLNVATAAVATIAVGVGLDYLIYIAFRIREALQRGDDYETAVLYGHRSAGGAALCVASAVAVGYLVLMLSPGYLLHHWIAALVPMTMISSLFGALFVFPFLVRLWRPTFGLKLSKAES
ncbi:efflux RND transporter permease subunit [Caulobacter sp. NIBR2454]|uniref:efflux RND transporter permease subunit n=1 Tax=Caulobacter sp. NIBR2454 TaxID=3015996 RepID=UPI0022B66C91|nr:MMPL family transporter [Caulobacter sp. NIBR2454]